MALGKLCIAQYKAGMHVKVLDEWTVHCDLCDCKFHCREVMRVGAVEKHVFSGASFILFLPVICIVNLKLFMKVQRPCGEKH